jgi:hypothetical protein
VSDWGKWGAFLVLHLDFSDLEVGEKKGSISTISSPFVLNEETTLMLNWCNRVFDFTSDRRD